MADGVKQSIEPTSGLFLRMPTDDRGLLGIEVRDDDGSWLRAELNAASARTLIAQLQAHVDVWEYVA